MTPAVTCPKCGESLPEPPSPDGETACPMCHKRLFYHTFPAMNWMHGKGALPGNPLSDDDARCFSHPDKLAASNCAKCGAYMCKLCELDIAGRLLCPTCFNADKDKIDAFKKEGFLYDNLMLLLSLLCLGICYLNLLVAPVVLGASFYYWNKVQTPYPRSRWRFVAAIAISSLIIIAWVAIIGGLALGLLK